jgi:hypothetical protein
MLQDLRMKEPRKQWLTYGLSATAIHPYQQALASRAKTCAEDCRDETISSHIGERRSWPRSHDVLAFARTASGL